MASLNKVFLMGNLTRDPQLRQTPNGASVAEIGLAVNRVEWAVYKDQVSLEDTFMKCPHGQLGLPI